MGRRCKATAVERLPGRTGLEKRQRTENHWSINDLGNKQRKARTVRGTGVERQKRRPWSALTSALQTVRTKDQGCDEPTESGNQEVPGNLKKSSFTGERSRAKVNVLWLWH